MDRNLPQHPGVFPIIMVLCENENRCLSCEDVRNCWTLLLRVSRKLPVRQPHTAEQHLIRAHGGGRLVSGRACRGHVVVLFHAIARYAEATDQLSIAIERGGSRKEN